MSPTRRKQQLFLSSAALLGVLSSYSPRAYAVPNCSPDGPMVQCSGGVFATPEVVTNADTTQSLAVSVTPAPFQVTTNAGNALTITGNGAVSFDDTYAASNLDASSASGGIGLAITSNGDTTGTIVTPGGITVDINGAVSGDDYGIRSDNRGSGDTSITVSGTVRNVGTQNRDSAIYAQNGSQFTSAGRNMTITTSAGSTVEGRNGIYAFNFGNGDSTVKAYGDVIGTIGISIANGPATKDITITTGPGTTVGGAGLGIGAINLGSGDITIAVNGNVRGYGTTSRDAAIYGRANTAARNLAISTAKGSDVKGELRGIFAFNYGTTGNISIRADGDVTGDDGIYARHDTGGDIKISTGASSTITSNGVGANDFAIQTHSGPTDLTVAGTLNGGVGGAVSFDQFNALDDRLELRAGAVINGNVLAGDGEDLLEFAGAGNGTFNLNNIDTGTNTQQYQGFEKFVVKSAVWTMNGQTSANFLVEGGTLKGNGTFGDLIINGGTLSPGNSFGTITVNGVFALNSGSTFEVEVNADNENDLVVVNGTVNLTGATLRILAANGDYAPETDYVIIDNDGNDAVDGVFGTITSSLAFLIPTVIYDGGTGNDVVLTLTRNEVDPCDVANTANQKATCGAIIPEDALFDIILGQTVQGARQAFDALSGEIHATAAGVLVDDNRYVREAILGRLMQANHRGEALGVGGPQTASYDRGVIPLGSDTGLYDGKSLIDEPEAPSLAFWTAGFGAWGKYDGDGNAATADRNLGGFMSGMDASIGDSWTLGLTTGASFSDVTVDDRFSSADAESYYLGGYAGGMAGSFALRGGGTWAWSEIDTSRAVIFPGFFERQNANYDAETGQIFGEVAYPTSMGGLSVEPFGGLAYVSIDTDRFVERGGPLASLRGRDSDQSVGYTTLGMRIAATHQWGSMTVVPNLSARWQHAFDDVTPEAALAIATTGTGFTVAGVPLAEDSVLIDAGLDFALGENTSGSVSYSGQYGEGVQDNAVKGQFTWLF